MSNDKINNRLKKLVKFSSCQKIPLEYMTFTGNLDPKQYNTTITQIH